MLGLLASLTATPNQRRLARSLVQFSVNRYGANAEDELRHSLTDPRTKKARKALRLAVQQIERRHRSSIFVTVA